MSDIKKSLWSLAYDVVSAAKRQEETMKACEAATQKIEAAEEALLAGMRAAGVDAILHDNWMLTVYYDGIGRKYVPSSSAVYPPEDEPIVPLVEAA